MIIHILNKNEESVGVLSNDAPFSCPFFDDRHVENVRMGTNSYEFSVPANHEMASKLETEGSVIFPDLDGKMQMFTIKNIEEVSNENGYIKHVYTEHVAISDLLTDGVVRPFSEPEASLYVVMQKILEGTDYEIGDWGYKENVDIVVENYSTILGVLYQVAEDFQVEVQFEVIFKNGKIIKKLIHMNEQLGAVTHNLFTYSKDIVEVVRTENSEALVTALIGVGKGDEDGNLLTLENHNPAELPEGFYKRLEDDYIYSESALQAYGKNGKHMYGVYISDSAEDVDTLTKETVQQLKARSVPFITYDMKIVTLERVTGYEANKVRVGDTINAKDISMNPPLMIEARVLEISRSYTDSEKDELVLGNYRPVKINAYDDIEKIRQAIIANEGKWSNGGVTIPEVEEVVEGKVTPIERDLDDVKEEMKHKEYAIIRQDEEPEGTDYIDGQLWMDGKGNLHRWTGTEWDKLFKNEIEDLDVITQEEFSQMVEEMSQSIADKAGVEYVEGVLKHKADADSVYTKVEADDKLKGKADGDTVYTKKEVDNALDNKVGTTTYTADKDGIIKDLKSQESRIEQTEEGLRTTVSSDTYNKKINELSTNIDGKADTTVVNALETRIKNNTTAIEQTDKEIGLKANSKDVFTKTETTTQLNDKASNASVKTVTDRVVKAEASIKVNADAIVSKAEKSDVYTKKESDGKLNTAVTNAKSEIKQTTDSISQSVEKVTQEVEGMEIGTGNLLKNTSSEFKNLSVGQYFQNIEEGALDTLSTYGLSVGDTVTFKVYIKSPSTKGGRARISTYRADNTYPTYTGNIIPKGKEGYSEVTTTIQSDMVRILFAIQNDDTSVTAHATYQYKEAIVVKGNKAGTWYPAPEDFDGKIDAVNKSLTSAKSEILQTTDAITQSVSKVRQDLTAQGKTVSEHTASIKNLGTSIEQRVTKTEMNEFKDSVGNLVNNPEITGNVSGWLEGGVVVNTQTFEGESIKVLRNTATGNAITYSKWFDVDTSKAYEVSIWVKKSANRGRMYFGLHGNNGTGVGNNITFTRVSTGGASSASSNAYFYSIVRVPTVWEKITGYIMPSGTDRSEMVGIGTSNVNHNIIMPPNTKRIRLRWLNYDNGGTTTYMYVANPKVVEVSSDAVSRITSAESRIAQTEKDINLRVTTTTYNADVGKLKTDMTKAMADIKLNATGITQRVTKTEYNGNTIASMINQTATTIKLQASKINLVGAVSFSTFDTATQNRVTTAQNDASSAKSTAGTANTTANTARTTANTANTNANTAKTNATNAINRVNTVEGKINNAVTTIDGTGVTVKDGSFYLLDDMVSTKYSIVPRTNLIADHSFELVGRGSTVTGGFNMQPTSDGWGMWANMGTPRLYSALNSDQSGALFGHQTILVNNTNNVYQRINLEGSTTYTLSAHFTGSPLSASGLPRLMVRHYDFNRNLKQTWNKAFPIVRFSDTLMSRHSLTFTVPNTVKNGDYFRVDVMANNGSWIYADGVQLVEGNTPTQYQPEDAIWNVLNNVKGYQFRGDIETKNTVIAQGFTSTGGRFYGMTLRSESGHAIVQSVNANAYLQGTEARVTAPSDGGNYRPIRASSFPTGSSMLTKTNHEELTIEDAHYLLDNAKVHKYHLNSNLEERIYDKPKVGMFTQMIPAMLRDEDGVDTYSIVSTLWKVVQNQRSEIEQLKRDRDDIFNMISTI